jgi:hypothetical protein
MTLSVAPLSVARLKVAGDVPHFSIKYAFDGFTYALRFRWNERASRWTVDIGDEAEAQWYVCGWPIEPIRAVNVDGLIAIPDGDRLFQFMVFGRFFRPGYLLAWSPTGAPLNTQEGLGDVDFIYFDQATVIQQAADVAAAAEAAAA